MSELDTLFPIPTDSRNADDMGMPPTTCQRRKCGEYNMLKCVREPLHPGECCFVVDHDRDYRRNKAPNTSAKGPEAPAKEDE